MPRPSTGQIIRKRTKLGVSYGLRFWWRGKRIRHHIGGSWEGWTEDRVEDERKYLMAQVARGEYMPERPESGSVSSDAIVPTFQVLASVVLARHRRRVEKNTGDDLEWRLRTAMDHFGPKPVDRIDIALVDDFLDAKLREREAIEAAADAGSPVMEKYEDARNGRTYERRKRSLSNESINKVLRGVRRVLKEARRRGFIDDNPLDDPDCYLKVKAPQRSFLQVVQIEALLDAASLLDAEQRKLDRRAVRAIRASSEPATHLASQYHVSETLIRRIRRGDVWREDRAPGGPARLPIVASLVLAGPRITELCRCDVAHVEVAARVIHVPRTKTDASERDVPMVPSLHEILLAHRADRKPARSEPAYPTRDGGRQSPDNVRSRLLATVRARANELLEERDQDPIGHITPHTLRRTFASLLAELGVPPRRIMYLLGHEDPTLAMRVYEQVLNMGGGAVEVLERVLGCTLEDTRDIFMARGEKAPKGHPAQKKASEGRPAEA